MRWWTRVLRRRRLETHLDAELRDHLERQIADGIRDGLSEHEARRQAVLRFGGLDQIKESCRDARGTRWVDEAWQDVRYGVRVLRRSPGFTIVAVLSLALGIGANSAIFSIINSLLLRALPVREASRLVQVDGEYTNPIWEAVRARQSQIGDGAMAWGETSFDLSTGGQADLAQGLWTSGGFFDVLGVRPVLGRLLTPADDLRGGGPQGAVAIISHAFWQRRFGGAADIVGRVITLNRVPVTVVGITPPEFLGPRVGRAFDVALPIGVEALMAGQESILDRRSVWWLEIMLRQRPGQSVDDLQRQLRAVQPQIREATLPSEWAASDKSSYLREALTVTPASRGPSALRNQYRLPLLAIMGVVSLVLLIACANLANLALVRAQGRRHEVSVRLALGASRARLMRQLLTESLIIAALGAALGLVFARVCSQLLVTQLSTTRNRIALDLSLDWRVLAFTGVVAIATALLFGLAPALRARRVQPNDALKERMQTGAEGRWMLGTPLVVVQVALSLVLVAGAGLFMRTFATLATLPLGFERDPVLTVRIDGQRSTVDPSQRLALYDRAREAVAALPGVAGASLSVITPVSGAGWNGLLAFPDLPNLTRRDRVVWFNGITPGWFGVYGTRLKAGRDFTDRDAERATPVAVVNEAYARKYHGGRNPVGLFVVPANLPDGRAPEPSREIVGLVEDAAYRSIRDPLPATVYVPLRQSGDDHWPSVSLSLRAASGSPTPLTQSIVSAIAGVDRDLGLTVLPLAEQVNGTLARERTLAWLSGFFGGLALLLAGIGLYGVTSYGVTRRRTEIGIRMALGADATRVVRLVLVRALTLVAIGTVTGGLLTLWAARFVSSLVFGLQPRDPATLALATLSLLLIGGLAAWLPAWRASRLDAAKVLREG